MIERVSARGHHCARASSWLAATLMTSLWIAPLGAQTAIPAQPAIHQYHCLVINKMGTTVDAAEATHVLNRVTFGPNTALLNQVTGNGSGWQQFMQDQLKPASIGENSVLIELLDQLAIPTGYDSVSASTAPNQNYLEAIQRGRVAAAWLSNRQLNEVMTEFWENHFNTHYFQLFQYLFNNATGAAGGPPTQQEVELMAAWMEWHQHEQFRTHALGKFRTLLENLVLSPAMMIYLNMEKNDGCNGNENFAREFVELYTMGEFNEGTGQQNYDQVDIEELSKVFSGWDVFQDTTNKVFVSVEAPAAVPPAHCADDPKTLFHLLGSESFDVPAGTASAELAILLDEVCKLDATKDFICRKLMAHFLADRAADPGVHDGLLNNMKNAWGNDGDIANVLCVLFNSNAFQGPRYRWQRVRSPMELVAWTARLWDAVPNTAGVTSYVSLTTPTRDVLDIGQPLFTFPSPDGFPLDSIKRLGSSAAIETAVAGSDVFRGLKPWLDIGVPLGVWFWGPSPFYVDHVQNTLSLTDQADPQKVAEVLLDRMYPSIATTVDENAVITALGTLDPNNLGDYALDLARGISIAASFTYATLR